MKKYIILILALAFVSASLQAQSFMDKMKSETTTKQNTTTPANQSTRSSSRPYTQSSSSINNSSSSINNSSPAYMLKNRWKKTLIQVSGGRVVDGSVNAFNSSGATWNLIPVFGTNFIQIKNTQNGTYLHCEYGSLQSGALGKPDWHSSQWEKISVPGTNFVQLRNRFTKKYLHNEYGSLALGDLGKPSWHSAQWELVRANGSISAGSNSNPTMNYPNAVEMYFRYTDQVQGGRSLNLKVGDRVKVLEGQTISDSFLNKKLDEYNGKVYYGKTGLSFDPKNPKICGKIFTVASTSPLKFTEDFPENMRNGFNSSFKFKVIKL